MRNIIFCLMLFFVLGSNSSFAQYDYDAIAPSVSLKQRLSESKHVYLTIPKNMDDYTKYSVSCINTYFSNLGISVTKVPMKYNSTLNKVSNTASVGMLSLPRKPLINDNNDYLIVMVDYGVVFQMFSGNECSVNITIWDPKTNKEWNNSLYPLPHKNKKVEAKLKLLFVDSLY